MSIKRDYKAFDIVLAVLVVGMAIFGIILITSANNYAENGLSRTSIQQIIWVVTGIIIMIVAAFIDYQFICKFYIPAYIINIIILLLTLIIKLATGATIYRSITIPGLGSIQPTEFSKLFMIIFLSRYIDDNKEKINSFYVLGSIAVLTAIPVVLMMQLPSLSASLVTFAIMLIIVFASKLSFKYIAIALLVAVPLVSFVLYDTSREDRIIIDKVLTKYQISRIETFLEPDEDSDEYYQTKNAISSIGSGQLNGKGLFNHVSVVPAADNDFIFTIVGEEFGFIGSIVTLGVMMMIIVKCIIVAYQAAIFYGQLIAAAVGGMFAFQVFVHVGVNIGIIPNTGMAFPFLSAGGSSLWISMACVGLVLNIGMTRKKSMFAD